MDNYQELLFYILYFVYWNLHFYYQSLNRVKLSVTEKSLGEVVSDIDSEVQL